MCATTCSGTAAYWNVISKGSLAGLATENHPRDLLEKQSKDRRRAKWHVLFAATVSSDKLWWHRNPKTDRSTLSGQMPILTTLIFLVLISVRWGWWMESHLTKCITEITMSSTNYINGIKELCGHIYQFLNQKENLCLNSFQKPKIV